MLDQLFGLVLLGLGIQSPLAQPAVLGRDTQKNESSISAERKEINTIEMERRKTELEAKRKEMEVQYKAKREQLKTELSERKDAYMEKKSSRAGELKMHIEEEREAFIETMKAKIEEAHVNREEHLAAFKEKLSVFKDKAKQTKVEDIQSRITSFVSKRIEIMTAQITKMTDIVGVNKTQVAERANGKDTNAFDSAAAAALAAINTAKDKLSAFSAKQYVVTVSSESGVKSDVESVRKTVETDTKAVAGLMKSARIAVSKMIIERAKVLGEPQPEAVIK